MLLPTTMAIVNLSTSGIEDGNIVEHVEIWLLSGWRAVSRHNEFSFELIELNAEGVLYINGHLGSPCLHVCRAVHSLYHLTPQSFFRYTGQYSMYVQNLPPKGNNSSAVLYCNYVSRNNIFKEAQAHERSHKVL